MTTNDVTDKRGRKGVEIPVTDDELLTADYLPCRDCGSPVYVGNRPNGLPVRPIVATHRRRIAWMDENDLDDGWSHPYMQHFTRESTVAALRAAVVCISFGMCRGCGERPSILSPCCEVNDGPFSRHAAVVLRWGECAHCGKPFHMRRSDARFCSGRCRVAAHRANSR